MCCRHGDKGIEARLVRLDDFMKAATQLQTTVPDLQRRIFISTEDPSVVASSSKYSKEWDVLYTKVDRENLPGFARLAKFGGVEDMLNSLMNLQLAVECDAWICTLSSNWCRLIDALRSVVAGKADRPYVDIGFRCFQGCDL